MKAGITNIPTKADLDKAREEIAQLKAEAANARAQWDEVRSKAAKSRRDAKNGLRLAAVIMMTAALIKVAYFEASADPKTKVIEALSTGGGASLEKASGETAKDAQFMKAMDRLRDAFHAFPEQDQMDVVRDVNARHPGAALACPLVWNNGQPHILVGQNVPPYSPSVIAALNQCSSEIETLRNERNAGAR